MTIRSPDWRWQEALAIHDSASIAPKDPDVRTARRFWSRHRQAFYLRQRQQLQREMPAFAAAHAVYFQQRLLAEAIECRILADQVAAVIAERSGLELEAIRIYEAVFYDVRRHRNQRDLITQVVVGHGPAGRTFEQQRKLLAYEGGPEKIDQLLGTARPAPAQQAQSRRVNVANPLTLLKLIAEFDPDQASTSAGASLADLVRQRAQLQALCQSKRRSVHRAPQSPDSLLDRACVESLRSTLHSLRWQVGPPAAPSSDPIIAHFDASAVELRAHHLTLLRLGLVPADLPGPLNFPAREPSTKQG